VSPAPGMPDSVPCRALPKARALDIIVPLYRNAELAERCIDSLLDNLGEIACRAPRLLLVNDSPDDREIETLLSVSKYARPEIVQLTNASNLGFVCSANRGLAHSRTGRRDALLVNSDTITFPGTLKNLVEASSADPQIGFASPRSNNASLTSLPHYHGGRLPTPAQAIEHWRALAPHMPQWHFTPTAVGFYLYIRYEVLANHGLLSEEFGRGYEEENDLIMRAGKVGWRAVLANHAFAYHSGSASFRMLDIDLKRHREENLGKITRKHPEFLTLVRRYESSAHFRAERILAGLIPDPTGRLRVAIDLSSVGAHHNGTNEHTVAFLHSIATRWSHQFQISVVAARDAFEFHRLNTLDGIRRVDTAAPGDHAIALRIAQPFKLRNLRDMANLAPINVYAMLDTIAEDCGPLSADMDVAPLWDHVASNSNGLVFNSKFGESQFLSRHRAASRIPRLSKLLSTCLADYRAVPRPSTSASSHVLIVGNHFAHKGVERSVELLRSSFPTLQFIALAGVDQTDANVTFVRSGGVEQDRLERLFADASAVVLPSYVEGFGLGLMHALAAGRAVVARRIPATEEILGSFESLEGVHLFDTDPELPDALLRALSSTVSSHVVERQSAGWNEWTDAVCGFLLGLTRDPHCFDRLVDRIASLDALEAASAQQRGAEAPSPPRDAEPVVPDAVPLEQLLGMDGRRFVQHAYATLLQRNADESGLAFYVAELDAGTDKIEILRALSSSDEAKSRGIAVEGLDEMLQRSEVDASTKKRWFWSKAPS
jgi:GT2 family glycosyltransferase